MKVNLKEAIPNFLIILIGIVLMLFPELNNNGINSLFYIAVALIGSIRLMEYIFQKDKDDKENLHVALASFLAPVLYLLNQFPTKMHVSLLVIVWVCGMGISKLNKLDYLHDLKSEKFTIKLYGFILFIIVGTMIATVLLFASGIEEFLLGMLFFIYAIMDFFKDYINNFFENYKLTRKKKTTK